jgi:DNA-directed RNA polymerase specialized sigma24 family protein
MPATFQLSEAEQDAVLLRIYALAQHHAQELVGSRRREDLVQDLALDWLERLRAGTFDVVPAEWDEFVVAEIWDRKDGVRRSRRRAARRDLRYLEIIANAPREWMSPALRFEEEGLREFAEQVRQTLPGKCVRAHRLVRDDQMTYTEAGKRLGISRRRVHEYLKTVHRAFRGALPAVDITPSSSRRGGRPARARRRATRACGTRRHRRPSRGGGANVPRVIP